MKVIIAGSREIADPKVLIDAIRASCFNITEVVSGCARGVDRMGEKWASENQLPVKYFPAYWQTYGQKAGFLRNAQMAEYGEALIAVWDGKSLGTKNMIALARAKGLQVFVYRWPPIAD